MNELTTLNPLKSYEDFCRYADVSEKTRSTYFYNLKPFVQYIRDNGITAPTREDIIAYREYLKASGKKATTISAYIAVIRVFFDWLEEAGIYRNVAKRIKGAKVSRDFKKDYLTVSQIKSVVAPMETESEQGARDYAVVALMAVCGLRTIEVARANVEDLAPLGGKTVLYVQGKGKDDKVAFVIVPEAVEKAIRAYLVKRGTVAPNAPLFACTSNNNKGGRLTTTSVSAIAKKAMVSAGFSSERLTAHSLRHSAITNAILAGNTIEDTQAFARHANIATTMIYNHAIDNMKNQCAVSVANAIFN